MPSRYADSGHQGIAVRGTGKQTVLPLSGHISGTPYRWPRGGPCREIADLPGAPREWVAEKPSLPSAKAAVLPVRPARPAAKVERDLRLHGVPEGLRRRVARAHDPARDGDRSVHWCKTTSLLLGAHVSDALIGDATRVAEWGCGARYRDADEGWLASAMARAGAGGADRRVPPSLARGQAGFGLQGLLPLQGLGRFAQQGRGADAPLPLLATPQPNVTPPDCGCAVP